MNHWQRRAAAIRLETDGKTVTHPNYDGWRFTVAPVNEWSTSHHRAAARVAMLPENADYLRRFASGSYVEMEGDDAIDFRLRVQTFVEGSLRSWSVTNADGDALELNSENGVMFFETFRDIFEYLYSFARTPSNYAAPTEAEKTAAVAGNLPRASNTSKVRGAKA